MDNTRRKFLVLAGLTPVALFAARAAQAADPVCYDPAALPLSQKNRRRGLGYVEPSADPKKRCGGCAFFNAADNQVGCGKCQMLSGGPVSALGVCNSFAPKA